MRIKSLKKTLIKKKRRSVVANYKLSIFLNIINYIYFLFILFIDNKIILIKKQFKNNIFIFIMYINYFMGIGDWGLGIGEWGLGIGPNPQSPIPNPQSPIPNPQYI